MVGFKKQLKESLQVRLSFTLSVAIVIVALVAGVFSFISAKDEANELQDDVLRQVALLFDRQHITLNTFHDDHHILEGDEESRVIIQHLTDGINSDGRNIVGNVDDGAPLAFPVNLSDGFHTLNIGGEPFRVLVKTITHGERIALAQETGIRDEIARESALRTLMPFLILMPILLLVVSDLVRKIFRPIAVLSREIDLRGEHELHAVAEHRLPIEVRPFAVAINRLLDRVKQAMTAQSRFVSDAAHELRSPLTALSLQAERLADAEMSAQAHERLRTLRMGIERGRNLLDQLLMLAKLQSLSEIPQESVSVRHVYCRVLEDLLPLAEAKNIDIGIVGEQDPWVMVNELYLMIIVKNLVDNAIRYTPLGGRVDLFLTVNDGHARLEIRDTGVGIPHEEKTRVFDPFYRVLGSDQIGSGLGLSIVKTIIDQVNAEIILAYADELNQVGLSVVVIIPLAGMGKG